MPRVPYDCACRSLQTFVLMSLAMLLGLHIYSYLWGPVDGDITDVKYVVMQLSQGLSEVKLKHEALKGKLEQLSAHPSKASFHACSNLKDDGKEYDRQMTDFALESAGARVLGTGDTVSHMMYESPVGYALHLLATLMCRSQDCMSARAMLRPDSRPGECWAFKGPKGEAIIRLVGKVFVTGLCLEHISPQISPTQEISSAPRVLQLEGLDEVNDKNPHLFGYMEYDKNGDQIQYFKVPNLAGKPFNIVRLRILSNWGHPVYTCVYRVRIHGELAPGQGAHLLSGDGPDV